MTQGVRPEFKIQYLKSIIKIKNTKMTAHFYD
jgi:hypothetical protein